MTGGQVAVIAVFSVLVFAILIVGVFLLLDRPIARLPNAQVQAPLTQATSAQVATASATPPEQPTYPPTWTPTVTPTPSRTPSITPTPSPVASRTPTRTPTRTPRPTQSVFGLVQTFSGSGSGSTDPLALKPGHVRIDWSYSGPKTGGGISAADQAYHNAVLQTYYTWYINSYNIYKRELDRAVAARDALRVDDIQHQMNALKNEYDQYVAIENQRYASVVPQPGMDNTPFNLSYADVTIADTIYLANNTGSGAGQAFFDSAGSRYILQVQSSGNWTLKVYYKP